MFVHFALLSSLSIFSLGSFPQHRHCTAVFLLFALIIHGTHNSISFSLLSLGPLLLSFLFFFSDPGFCSFFSSTTGSAFPIPCTGGYYCERLGQSAVTDTDRCYAGFYCSGGASRPNVTDGITGNLCPAGSYCPAGSAAPLLCPPGTFSSIVGNMDESDCIFCLGGFYCNGSGLATPTAICPSKYFCPNGTIVPVCLCFPPTFQAFLI